MEQLDPVSQKFILHWGEMGSRWGVNRTVSQIHGLLFLSDRPMHAEEIADTLGVARSNVSTSLKELQSWGLVSIVHILADRRDHYMAHQDVHDIFKAVVEGRKRREVDPTLTVLRDCLLQADESTPANVKRKLQNVTQFMETLLRWYDDMKKLQTGSWLQLMKMGARVQSALKKTG
jgi:DNA-binding transcriptional regulator GbsR (MarR family)